jgi:serine/threonine protein kinase
MYVLSHANITAARVTQLGRPVLSGEWIRGTWKEQICRGDFANVHFLDINESVYAVKQIRDDSDRDQLVAELKILTKFRDCTSLVGADHVIRLVEEWTSDEDGILSALVLHPVGCTASALTDICIADFVEDVSAALEFAHSQSIVHCDVRPSNIIRVGDRYVLIDWGMAAEVQTKRGSTHGVPSFVHDEVLLIDKQSYIVAPYHDFTSLAYSVLAVVFGRDGFCPWECVSRRSDEIKRSRDLWLDQWRNSDNVEHVHIVDQLLSTADCSADLQFTSLSIASTAVGVSM